MDYLKMLMLSAPASGASENTTNADDAAKIIGTIADQLSSWDKILVTLGKMAIAAVIGIIAIQIYRYAYKRKWKKNSPSLKEKFTYNIVLITMYIVTFFMVVAMLPEGDKIVFGLISSTGFIALGLGLAAQESLSNLVNGMMISVAKPFEVGDRIHLVDGDITGIVEDITLRHTVIKTFVNSRVMVPNSTINQDMIENSNYQQGRASSFIDVIILYDSDIDLARKIIANVVGNHPDYVDLRDEKEKHKPKVKVFVRDLSSSGIGLRASMWTSSVDNNFEASSDARYEIFKEFQKHGILFSQMPGRPETWLPEFDMEKRNTSHKKAAIMEELHETSNK